MAIPLRVLQRSGDEAVDHASIAEVVSERDVGTVVVGLPISLDGSLGRAAVAVGKEVARLVAALDVPVETQDERLSTVAAERSLQDAGVGGRRRREVVDMVAATILLQSWLDTRARSPAQPSPED